MPQKGIELTRECQPGISLLSIADSHCTRRSHHHLPGLCIWLAWLVPAFHPGRGGLAIACGLFMIGAGVGLLFCATVAIAVRSIFPFLLAWLRLKVPAVGAMPRIEGVWIGFGEIGMLLAGGWVLFARLSGLEKALLLAHHRDEGDSHRSDHLQASCASDRALAFCLSQSHDSSRPIVDAFPNGLCIPDWVWTDCLRPGNPVFYLATRATALIETGMLALFAFLVWGPNTWIAATPKMAGAPPGARFPLTAFLITWVIGASALLIACDGAEKTVELSDFERDRSTQADLAELPKEASR